VFCINNRYMGIIAYMVFSFSKREGLYIFSFRFYGCQVSEAYGAGSMLS
jgi:hypothetical protein